MSSYFPNVKEPWSGPLQQFKIVKKADSKPIPVNVSWDKVNPQQYFIGEPDLKLAWTAGPQTELVTNWKVTWKEENDVGLRMQVH